MVNLFRDPFGNANTDGEGVIASTDRIRNRGWTCSMRCLNLYNKPSDTTPITTSMASFPTFDLLPIIGSSLPEGSDLEIAVLEQRL
jgi:hypothetical protein